MTYPILQRWLKEAIQERTPVTPTRLVIHSTANPGASDENHFLWLDAARRHGWANYYLDHDSISQVVPEGLKAPAQGPTYNAMSLSIELCEPATTLPWAEQVRRFDETWKRGVWLSADILFRHGWPITAMVGHFEVSQQVPNETDHTDPLPFFKRFGKTWTDWRADVAKALEERKRGYPTEAPEWKWQAVRDLVGMGLLHDMRHPLQPVEWWELALMLARVRQ